jgi:hypothetical protein
MGTTQPGWAQQSQVSKTPSSSHFCSAPNHWMSKTASFTPSPVNPASCQGCTSMASAPSQASQSPVNSWTSGASSIRQGVPCAGGLASTLPKRDVAMASG